MKNRYISTLFQRMFIKSISLHAITLNMILCMALVIGVSLQTNTVSAFENNKSPEVNLEGAAQKTQKPLIIGIFPRRNKIVTQELFLPMARYLEKKLNRPVELIIPRSFSIFWDDIQEKKYDLVHYNQYHYVVSKKQYGYNVILRNKEFGSDTLSSSIVVRKDSGINSVEDLKGKTIVFGGGQQAMQSYIFARFLLQNNNLHQGEYIEEYALNPPNALYSMYYGKSAAAGIGDKVIHLDMVKHQVNVNKLKTLVVGKQLPQLPWAVQESLPTETKEKITIILSSMHKNPLGKSVLKAAKLNQLIVSSDEDYDEHRGIIQAVLGETH